MDSHTTQTNLYQAIGKDRIVEVITEFYKRAFDDPIIGHFFFNKDCEDITRKQINFACAMLGGPEKYTGKPLTKAHEDYKIRRPHFGRRQVLMAEVLTDFKIPEQLAQEWLAREDKLRDLIINSKCPKATGLLQ